MTLSTERGGASDDNSPLGYPGHVRGTERPYKARGVRDQLVHSGGDARAVRARPRCRPLYARIVTYGTHATASQHYFSFFY